MRNEFSRRYYVVRLLRDAAGMYSTWTCSGDDAETVARALEAHLNEFADEVVSVSYSVDSTHHVLVVYKAVSVDESPAEAVAVAEQILDMTH